MTLHDNIFDEKHQHMVLSSIEHYSAPLRDLVRAMLRPSIDNGVDGRPTIDYLFTPLQWTVDRCCATCGHCHFPS
jgi:hypothetical protein